MACPRWTKVRDAQYLRLNNGPVFSDMEPELSKLFASELRAVVIGVNYRLAPEHPFPLPLNDCYTALNWTLDNAGEYMIDPKRVAIWGFSSGGNLAAAVALKDSTENTTPRIKHVNLVVPVTCHPRLYPPTLSSSGASAIKFGTSKEAELYLTTLQKLWGKFMEEQTRRSTSRAKITDRNLRSFQIFASLCVRTSYRSSRGPPLGPHHCRWLRHLARRRHRICSSPQKSRNRHTIGNHSWRST
jgi:acetyl esterase/lipase